MKNTYKTKIKTIKNKNINLKKRVKKKIQRNN